MVSVFELQIALATKNFKTLKNLIIYYGSFTLLNLFFFFTKKPPRGLNLSQRNEKTTKKLSRVSLKKNVTLTFIALLLIMVTLSMMMTIMMRMMMSVVVFISGFFHKHFTHGAWGKVTPC